MTIGSSSGRIAAAGAFAWAALTAVGLVLTAVDRRLALALLATCTLISVVIDVALPLLLRDVGWSPLGVLQTIAVAAALACFVRPGDARRDG